MLLLFCRQPLPRLQLVLEKLGDALFIAGVLALLVDTALKEKLIAEFVEDVSAHIIGELLPLGLRDHIRRYLKMPFVRTEWTITIVIDRIPGKQNVQLTVTSDYVMQNLTREKQIYHFVVAAEKSWFPDLPKSRIQSVKFDHRELKGKDLDEKDDRHGNITFGQDVKFPPDGHAGASKSFQAIIQQTYWENSFCPFDAKSLVMKTTVIVVSLMGEFEIELDLTSEARVPEAARAKGKTVEQWTWVIDEPMLPGQGLYVRWEPRKKIGALSSVSVHE